MSFLELLLFGVLASFANLVGGFLLAGPHSSRINDRLLKYLVALGAGFMLAAIFLEIVPETFRIWTTARPELAGSEGIIFPMTLLLAGYLLIQLFEHTLAPHFHFGEETHPEIILKPHAAYSAVGGLMIHTFFDGVSIAAAFLVDRKSGLLFFLETFLHKVPKGFPFFQFFLAPGRSTRKPGMACLQLG